MFSLVYIVLKLDVRKYTYKFGGRARTSQSDITRLNFPVDVLSSQVEI